MKELETVLTDFKEDLDEAKCVLEDKAEQEVARQLRRFLNDYSYVLEGCESPIERLFAASFVPVFRESKLSSEYQVAEINPNQVAVTYEDGEIMYRTDFSIYLADPNKKEFKFAIECDGHDYHEKTKEQAADDRFRERRLMQEGFIVIRFTGSEIHRDSNFCAYQAVWTMLKIVEQYQ